MPIAIRTMLPMLALLAAHSQAAAQPDALDARTLISGLARPAPASVVFTEVRFSALLKEPVIVSGVLGYEGPDTLDRRVTAPYHEETEIRGSAVRVRRENEPERSFAVRRAPELQALLDAFTALLQGDYAAIERTFAITTTGDTAVWQLSLTPKDARLARRVEQIRIDGRSDTPRCFAIINSNQSASVMLLGAATHVELRPPLTQEWLERTCAANE